MIEGVVSWQGATLCSLIYQPRSKGYTMKSAWIQRIRVAAIEILYSVHTIRAAADREIETEVRDVNRIRITKVLLAVQGGLLGGS